MLGYAAGFALPSVILILMFGQTRIFFVMARDGLLPESLSAVHPKWKTPYKMTAITGAVVAVGAAFFPVGRLADWANAGTLYAFMMVAICVMILRRTAPDAPRAFRTPALWLIGPATIAGTIFLFFNLDAMSIMVFTGWGALGLLVYFLYGRGASHLGRGITDVVDDIAGEEKMIPFDPPRS